MSAYGLIALVAVAALWGTLTTRLVARHHKLTRYDALLFIFALGATVDAGIAQDPALIPPIIAHSLWVASSFGGLLIGIEIVRLMRTGDVPVSRVWMWRAATIAAWAALTVTAILGQPAGSFETADWQSLGWMVGYWVGYGTFHITACVAILGAVLTFLQELPPGPLKQATAMIALALAIGIVFGIGLIALAWDGLGLNSGLGALGYEAGSIGYLLAAGAYIRIRVARSGRRGADARVLAAIRPLWRRLSQVNPAVCLSRPPTRVDSLTREELSLACLRCAIEIRDWMHLLSRRMPPDAYEKALLIADELLPAANHRWLTAAATAGWIQFGLSRPATCCASVDWRAATPANGRDVDEDLALLADVAGVDGPTRAAVADVLRARVDEQAMQRSAR